jgi:hypothetical protein
MPLITVVVPTIRGREIDYERCVDAYRRTTDDVQLITVRDLPTCGEAWNEGAKQAAGDYLHLTCDDLEPHDGWWQPAIEAVRRGYLPAPRVVNADGVLDSCGLHGVELPDKAIVQMSVIPFMSREQWDKIGPTLSVHYFSDNWLSWRGAQEGYPTVVRRQYSFTHHWAQPGRGAGMTYSQRMEHDHAVYLSAVDKGWRADHDGQPIAAHA